jgi:hypothetical protein
MNPNLMNQRGKATRPFQAPIIHTRNQNIVDELANRDSVIRRWLGDLYPDKSPATRHEHHHYNEKPHHHDHPSSPPSNFASNIATYGSNTHTRVSKGASRTLDREWTEFKWKLEDNNVLSKQIKHLSSETLIKGIKYLDQKHNLLQVMDYDTAVQIMDNFCPEDHTQLTLSRNGSSLHAQPDWTRLRGMEEKGRGELEVEFWRLSNDVKYLSGLR